MPGRCRSGRSAVRVPTRWSGPSLGPQLDLAVLDVLGQDRLAEVTRSLVWMLVADDAVRSEEALDLAQRFGVVVGGSPTITDMPTTLAAETRTYLAAVLLDFATADDQGGADDLGAVAGAGPPGRSGRRAAADDRRRAGPGRPGDDQGDGVGGLPAGGALMRRLIARAVDRGGLPADDVLGLLLPMFRTVQALHETGRVAPLRGLAALDDEGDDPVTIDVSRPGRRSGTGPRSPPPELARRGGGRESDRERRSASSRAGSAGSTSSATTTSSPTSPAWASCSSRSCADWTWPTRATRLCSRSTGTTCSRWIPGCTRCSPRSPAR